MSQNQNCEFDVQYYTKMLILSNIIIKRSFVGVCLW